MSAPLTILTVAINIIPHPHNNIKQNLYECHLLLIQTCHRICLYKIYLWHVTQIQGYYQNEDLLIFRLSLSDQRSSSLVSLIDDFHIMDDSVYLGFLLTLCSDSQL